jgi:hypothetical protein
MISASGLSGYLRLGFFIGGCGLIMAFMQPRESAEFVLSVCSALMGGALIAGVALLVRMTRRKDIS